MIRLLLIVVMVLLGLGCKSDDGGLSCGLGTQTTLANTDWPSFRRDSANTARTDVAVGTAQPAVRCLFPRLEGGDQCAVDPTGFAAIQTAPVVGDSRLYVVTQGGDVNVLDFEGEPVPLEQMIELRVTANTPLLGEDGTFYVASADGAVRRFESDGELDSTGTLLNFISAAPNIGPEGVIYIGTQGGTFAAVCPNGGLRFNLAVAPTGSTAGVTIDPDDSRGRAMIIQGGRSGRVQALEFDGDLKWSFNTTSQVLAAIVIDEPRNAFYVADVNGSVLSADLTGGNRVSSFFVGRCSITTEQNCASISECPAGEACIPESISASMALGASHLYVAGGATLYAFALSGGGEISGIDWQWRLPSPGSILSSPIIAPTADGEAVLFGADMEACAEDITLPCTEPCDSDPSGTCTNCTECRRGFAFAVDRSGTLWSVGFESAVGASSPSIRNADGSGIVYIGTQDGRLYEMDTGA